MKIPILCGIGAAMFVPALLAHAEDRFWEDKSGAWSESAGWRDGKLPGKEDAAKFTMGGTATLTNNAQRGDSVKYLAIGVRERDKAGLGHLILGQNARLWVWDWLSGGDQNNSSGTLELRDNAVLVGNGNVNFGAYGGTMKVSVSDRASFIINGESAMLGSKGTLLEINGGLVQHNNNRRAFIVGNSDGANASVQLNGGRMETGPIIVGFWKEYGAATGTFTQSGGTFQAGEPRRSDNDAVPESVIGDGEKATGNWLTSGGTAEFERDLIIGRNGNGALNVSGGKVVCRQKLIVGAGATGKGVVTVNGGTLVVNEIVGGEGESSLIIGPQGTLQLMGDAGKMGVGLKKVSIEGRVLNKNGRVMAWKPGG